MNKPVIPKWTMLLFLLLPTIYVAAQQGLQAGTSPATTTMHTPDQTLQDKAALSALNAQFIANFLSGDTVAHNQIIHPDFVCIESSGAIVARSQYMKEWVHAYAESGYTSFSYEDEVIRIFGDMALIRSKTVYTKIVNGQPVKGYSVYTDTYVKERGRWWCVQAHITPLKG